MVLAGSHSALGAVGGYEHLVTAFAPRLVGEAAAGRGARGRVSGGARSETRKRASGKVIGPAVRFRLLGPECQSPAVGREADRTVGTRSFHGSAGGPRSIDPDDPAR